MIRAFLLLPERETDLLLFSGESWLFSSFIFLWHLSGMRDKTKEVSATIQSAGGKKGHTALIGPPSFYSSFF